MAVIPAGLLEKWLYSNMGLLQILKRGKKKEVQALERAAANAAHNLGSLTAWKSLEAIAVSRGQGRHCKNISKSSNAPFSFFFFFFGGQQNSKQRVKGNSCNPG